MQAFPTVLRSATKQALTSPLTVNGVNVIFVTYLNNRRVNSEPVQTLQNAGLPKPRGHDRQQKILLFSLSPAGLSGTSCYPTRFNTNLRGKTLPELR